MAEETKKAVEELAKACDGNALAQAFVKGLAAGMAIRKDAEEKGDG